MAGEFEAAMLAVDFLGGGGGGGGVPPSNDEAFAYNDGTSVSVNVGGLVIPNRDHQKNTPDGFSFIPSMGGTSNNSTQDANMIKSIGYAVLVAMVSGLIVAKLKA